MKRITFLLTVIVAAAGLIASEVPATGHADEEAAPIYGVKIPDVLVLLGGMTWMSSGFFAPDGAYSRFVSPLIGIVWVLAASRVLLSRSSTRAAW